MEIHVAENLKTGKPAAWEEELLLRVSTEENPETNLASRPTQEKTGAETDWRMLYRLSGIRRNLLSWYDFSPASLAEGEKAELLEMDGGYGELTGLFTEKCRRVVSILPTKIRAEISAKRNTNPSLTLYAGSIKDLEIRELFDIVTLIHEPDTGEAGDEASFSDKLRFAKEHLRPGGTLITAVENRYGLSYMNGVRDMKNGRVFGSLLEKEEKTLDGMSKNSLKRQLTAAGFGSGRFYYPHPNHYLPMAIYSGRRLPREGELGKMPVFKDGRFVIFNEEDAWDAVIRDQAFPDFANAFLVFAEKPL